MKKLLFIILFLTSFPCMSAMTASSCKAKVKSAIEAGTGKPVQEGFFNVLEYLCEGIIEEIQTNGTVLPDQLKANIGGTLYPVVNTGKVQ